MEGNENKKRERKEKKGGEIDKEAGNTE